jgi:hypothetical protein
LQAPTQHTGGLALVWAAKIGPRVQSFARGLIYLFLAITAVRAATGVNASSQAQRQQLWTAKAMQHTGG